MSKYTIVPSARITNDNPSNPLDIEKFVRFSRQPNNIPLNTELFIRFSGQKTIRKGKIIYSPLDGRPNYRFQPSKKNSFFTQIFPGSVDNSMEIWTLDGQQIN